MKLCIACTHHRVIPQYNWRGIHYSDFVWCAAVSKTEVSQVDGKEFCYDRKSCRTERSSDTDTRFFGSGTDVELDVGYISPLGRVDMREVARECGAQGKLYKESEDETPTN